MAHISSRPVPQPCAGLHDTQRTPPSCHSASLLLKPKQRCSLPPGPHQDTELQTLGLLWLGAAGSMIMRVLGSVRVGQQLAWPVQTCRLWNVAANADNMDHHQYMHTAHGDAWWPGPIILHACNSMN
jgi:hypothetical protein